MFTYVRLGKEATCLNIICVEVEDAVAVGFAVIDVSGVRPELEF